MNIINYIHLILAAGGKCEVTSSGGKVSFPVVSVSQESITVHNEHMGIDIEFEGGSLDHLKIPRYTFAHLCRAVEADPLNNPAVRALQPEGLGQLTAKVESDRITLYTPGKWYFQLYRNFRVMVNVNWIMAGNDWALSMLREGYPVGIPAEHWIDREKLEVQS